MTNSFEDVAKVSNQYFDSSMASFSAVTKGAQAISTEATSYAKKALENGSATMEKLLSADSIETAVAVQTDYAKAAYEGFVSEATRMAELYADLAKDAYKPFESITARSY
ncbi:MAG: phasin family protein [Alphaproteobacteria bacterium]|jgi:phasin family protein|nr:phasin family protein [Alphaproteobacteria bacterium]MBU0802691.1 phasin family protein [Alphaproteobacteria bacterium]MBU0871488.1 phasin family protein [Alphaproteobacteria bacterium]MBU1400155.1 phasin family protein [Alphaproteobacteria bacterium]MBU1591275.1 phasin family protein [Alphaproteobacteria bacterium]